MSRNRPHGSMSIRSRLCGRTNPIPHYPEHIRRIVGKLIRSVSELVLMFFVSSYPLPRNRHPVAASGHVVAGHRELFGC